MGRGLHWTFIEGYWDQVHTISPLYRVNLRKLMLVKAWGTWCRCWNPSSIPVCGMSLHPLHFPVKRHDAPVSAYVSRSWVCDIWNETVLFENLECILTVRLEEYVKAVSGALSAFNTGCLVSAWLLQVIGPSFSLWSPCFPRGMGTICPLIQVCSICTGSAEMLSHLTK